MVRQGLRRSEIDWENVKIHVSGEEIEKEQEHEKAIAQTKQYLIENFPKFIMVNNVYYETEKYDDNIGMYEILHVDHIVIGDQAIYVIKTVKFPENVELYGSSGTKTWHYTENKDDKEMRLRRITNEDRRNQRNREYMAMLAKEVVRTDVPTIGIVNIIGLTDENIHLNLEYGHDVVTMKNLAEKIRYYENTIDSNRIGYEYCDAYVRKYKEEEVYDNIIPEIRDIELKFRVYTKLSEKTQKTEDVI